MHDSQDWSFTVCFFSVIFTQTVIITLLFKPSELKQKLSMCGIIAVKAIQMWIFCFSFSFCSTAVYPQQSSIQFKKSTKKAFLLLAMLFLLYIISKNSNSSRIQQCFCVRRRSGDLFPSQYHINDTDILRLTTYILIYTQFVTQLKKNSWALSLISAMRCKRK